MNAFQAGWRGIVRACQYFHFQEAPYNRLFGASGFQVRHLHLVAGPFGAFLAGNISAGPVAGVTTTVAESGGAFFSRSPIAVYTSPDTLARAMWPIVSKTNLNWLHVGRVPCPVYPIVDSGSLKEVHRFKQAIDLSTDEDTADSYLLIGRSTKPLHAGSGRR